MLGASGRWIPQWLHAHEMVFGFAAAAVAGFLLTATPSWASTRPLAGARLAALFALWLCARLLFFVQAPALWLAVVDLAFLPALFVSLWPAVRRSKPKNYVFLALLAAMWAGNLLCHLNVLGSLPFGLIVGFRTGIYAVVMMVTILSGRIIPGFTQNALLRRGQPREQTITTTDPRVDLAAPSCGHRASTSNHKMGGAIKSAIPFLGSSTARPAKMLEILAVKWVSWDSAERFLGFC